jgi:hypothetical protein
MAKIDYYYSRDIINIFGSTYNLSNIPILDIGDQMGDTNYIDFINSEYLYKHNMNNKIVRGIDKYNRPFISFRYKLYNIYGTFSPELFVETIFQSRPNEWYTCGHYGLEIIRYIGNYNTLNNITFNYIRRLVNNETCGTLYYDANVKYKEIPSNMNKENLIKINEYLDNEYVGKIFLE